MQPKPQPLVVLVTKDIQVVVLCTISDCNLEVQEVICNVVFQTQVNLSSHHRILRNNDPYCNNCCLNEEKLRFVIDSRLLKTHL